MTEHDYFEAWWKKQELGDKANYESNRALRMAAWNGWLARSAFSPEEKAIPRPDQLGGDATPCCGQWESCRNPCTPRGERLGVERAERAEAEAARLREELGRYMMALNGSSSSPPRTIGSDAASHRTSQENK